MKRTLILATVLTAVGISGAGLAMAAGTNAIGTSSATEAQMFQAAKINLDEAGKIALREMPGTLVAIGFNAENGSGVYEALIIGADGQPSIIKLDANTGAVLGTGLASVMGDEGDGGQNDGDGFDDGDGDSDAADGGYESDEG